MPRSPCASHSFCHIEKPCQAFSLYPPDASFLDEAVFTFFCQRTPVKGCMDCFFADIKGDGANPAVQLRIIEYIKCPVDQPARLDIVSVRIQIDQGMVRPVKEYKAMMKRRGIDMVRIKTDCFVQMPNILLTPLVCSYDKAIFICSAVSPKSVSSTSGNNTTSITIRLRCQRICIDLFDHSPDSHPDSQICKHLYNATLIRKRSLLQY